MTVSLQVLGDASAGPRANGNQPTMLSVGDSLMWGQGLQPANRFRELVRARLAQEQAGELVELSFARSGAQMVPGGNAAAIAGDASIDASVFSDPNPPLEAIYSPSLFAREVPAKSLTTVQQLTTAQGLLGQAGARDIRFIILDGGVNDVGIDGILTPIPAFQSGFLLSGWSSWLIAKCREIEGSMFDTLCFALDSFPSATIVVNGYFPVFSYWSVGHAARLQSVGLMHGIVNLALLNPFGLDALATASTTWQAASNKHLRGAIGKARHARPGRTVLFARSNIEEEHSLFAPQTWLWGYDAAPDSLPTSANQWGQWFAGATPEDEVIAERLPRCDALQPGDFACRLASIGHPNLRGAQDYADSIIAELEDAGVISSSLGECAHGERGRDKVCARVSDEWGYLCAQADARTSEVCADFVTEVGGAALGQFKEAGSSLRQAGDHLKGAAACFANPGQIAQAAQNQLGQAAQAAANAGEHVQAAGEECWDQTAIDMQRCSDTEASDIAACNASFSAADTGACNIVCTSFANCRQQFGRFNPARYACLAARGVCVAAAAVARGACLAGALAAREVCKAAAWAMGVACKAGVVVGNVACSAVEVTKAAGSLLVAGVHVLLGGAAAIAEIAGDGACALGQIGSAALDVGKAVGHGVGGVLLGTFAGVGYLGCRSFAWLANRGCRLGNWGAGRLCQLGSAMATGFCHASWPVRAIGRAVFR